jgi:dienelactone hydrolase
MRIAFRIFLLAIGLASSLGPAGELIEFPNLPEHAPASLLGYLARPDAGLSAILGSRSNPGGPYPAVVVLHGCGGISSHSAGIADRIGSWGYVALTVDSLGPRGMTSRCGSGLLDQAFDACVICRSWSSSMRRGWPCLANRWAGLRCSTRSIATWLRNISKSSFAPRSPITRAAASRRQT